MSEVIKEFWGMIVALVGGIVWAVRLETVALFNRAELRRVWAQRREDRDHDKSNQDRTDKRLDEISTDIKAILREMKR